VALARVEDILSPKNRRSATVRNDARPMPPTSMPPAASQGDWAVDQPSDEFSQHREAMPPRSQPDIVERQEGLLAGPRRLTNRAFDALDEMGEWVLGRRY